MNFYLERVESEFAPTGAALYPTPGQQLWLSVADVEPRAAFSTAARSFAIIGGSFLETFADGTVTLRGVVTVNSQLATISHNGTAGGQLFITSGGDGYCFVLATNVLTRVLVGEATMGGMLNARFLAFNRLNGKVRLSALNDGTTWDPNLYFQRALGSDPWQSMLIKAPEIWLIGQQTGEVWYDTGAYPQPFAPIPGGFFPYGTPAPFSAAVAGDYITWLAQDKDGVGSIVAARGYTPQAVSNFAVDTAVAGYTRAGAIADCEALVYLEAGHRFACFAFPTARATWCVDVTMGMAWGERGTWDGLNGRWNAWGPRVHTAAFGKHIVGNRGSSSLAILDNTFGSEVGGAPIRRMRIGPPVWASASQRQRLVVSRFQVRVEPGIALSAGQGSDPQIVLRTSSNAKTWSSERWASGGKLGDYDRRVVWTRCGSSDGLWVPEVVVTDAIPWRLSGAEIDGTGFSQAKAAA